MMLPEKMAPKPDTLTNVYIPMVRYLPHQLKFSIRGDETDTVLSFKLTKLDTLVELAVINSNRSFAGATKNIIL